MQLASLPILAMLLSAVLALLYFFSLKGIVDPASLALVAGYLSVDQLITYMFIHTDPLHLGIVVAFIMLLNWSMERNVGGTNTLILMVVGAVAGGLVWNRLADAGSLPLVGCSGAVTALLVMYLVSGLEQPVVRIVIALAWVIGQLPFAASQSNSTSPWQMHVGAAAAGLIGVLILRVFEKSEPKKEKVQKSKARARTESVDLADENAPALPEEAARSAGAGKPLMDPSEIQREKTLRLRCREQPDLPEPQVALYKFYMEAERYEQAARMARSAIRLLLKARQAGRAFDIYQQLTGAVGEFNLGPGLTADLLESRLTAGDWPTAVDLLEILRRVEPSNRKLPEYIATVCRLLMVHRGPMSEEARLWIDRLKREYPSHPAAVQVLKDMLQGADANMPPSGATVELQAVPDPGEEEDPASGLFQVKQLLRHGNMAEAARMLIKDQSLVGRVNSRRLTVICHKLAENETLLPRAAVLMELTIRLHLENEDAPKRVAELIDWYRNRLEEPARADAWETVLQDRWPESPAAGRLRAAKAEKEAGAQGSS